MEDSVEKGPVCLFEVELLTDRVGDCVFNWRDVMVKANNFMI